MYVMLAGRFFSQPVRSSTEDADGADLKSDQL